MFPDLLKAMQGADLLGVLISWELRTSGALLTRKALAEAAEKHGVKLDIKDPSREGVFRKIVGAVRTYKKALISRIVHEDDGVVVWAIVDTSLDGTEKVGDVAGQVVNRVAWRRVELDGQPQFTFAVPGELADAVADKLEFLTTYLTNDDVRVLLSATLRQWGSIRLHGRLHFLGRSHVEAAQRLQAVLQEAGTRAWLLPQPDLSDTAKAIGDHGAEQLAKDLADFRMELTRWTEQERVPKPKTLRARLTAYEQLRTEAKELGATMRYQVDDLLDGLAGLERAVHRLLKPEQQIETAASREATEDQEAGAANGATPPARPVPPGVTLDDMDRAALRALAKELGVKPMPRAVAALRKAIRRKQAANCEAA
jgi:hypothetical protein